MIPELEIGLVADGELSIEKAFLGAVTVRAGLQWTRGVDRLPKPVATASTTGQHITQNTGVYNDDFQAGLQLGLFLRIQASVKLTLSALAAVPAVGELETPGIEFFEFGVGAGYALF